MRLAIPTVVSFALLTPLDHLAPRNSLESLVSSSVVSLVACRPDARVPSRFLRCPRETAEEETRDEGLQTIAGGEMIERCQERERYYGRYGETH